MNQVTVVMYHFVRELKYTRYPEIKGLLVSEFKEQLAYMQKYYTFVTMEDCINALQNDAQEELPKNAVLLTFDDGYIDHYTSVFPILNEKGIQGSFFPPASAITNHEVLDVNKLHFLLASTQLEKLLKDVYLLLDKYRSNYSLKSNAYYFHKLGQAFRFDVKEIIFIKRLLQIELEEELRNLIVKELFYKYVTYDEQAFSRELYMNADQIKCMIRNGMYVGSHGYNHYWLNTLSPEKQEREIDLSLAFLREVGAPTNNWVMCYPYGAYNESLIHILERKSCALALTTKVDVAKLSCNNRYKIERLDTNDLPKSALIEANEWTNAIYSEECLTEA
ncbi:MAG: polysaccharide deacetylase family protein [Gammaproteobacteria bacterium]|nr:polysaccharide deacetylase family protein [Gammaproteobacteria bacterium]MCH9762719.1 polysaccharide deacetylase family protein [Gammaproteobacteria bacterium]